MSVVCAKCMKLVLKDEPREKIGRFIYCKECAEKEKEKS